MLVATVRAAKAAGTRITCEVTPHHLLLTDEAVSGFDPNTKMKPPLRGTADREALLQGLQDGTVDAIATDHAPHAAKPLELCLEHDLLLRHLAPLARGQNTTLRGGLDGTEAATPGDRMRGGIHASARG